MPVDTVSRVKGSGWEELPLIGSPAFFQPSMPASMHATWAKPRSLFTVRVRQFGDSDPADSMHALIQIK